MDLSSIQKEEVRTAVKSLKKNKALGLDELPPDYFKALIATDEGLQILLDVIQKCWENKCIPEEWHTSMLTLIFKKGDPALCDN